MFFIFVHNLKYINIFFILYTKCARKCLYVLQCAANQKRLRTTALAAEMLRLTVAAFRYAGFVVLWVFSVAMATRAPETSWRLLAVDPALR
jgi:hypothetical protein